MLGTMFLGGSFPWGNYVGDKPFKRHSGAISRGILRGAIIFGIIFREQSSKRQFSLGAIVWGVIFLWGNRLGGNNPGGNHPGGNCAVGHYPGGINFLRGNCLNTLVNLMHVKCYRQSSLISWIKQLFFTLVCKLCSMHDNHLCSEIQSRFEIHSCLN